MQQSRAGDTIEIGLSLACKALQSDMRDIEESTLFSQRPESIHSSIEDEDEEEGTPWEATLDISHSCAASASGLAESTDPFVHDELVNALAKGMNITLGKARRVSPSRRGWPIGIKLRQTVPPPPGPDPLLSSSASQHKHKGISPEMVKEPSVRCFQLYPRTSVKLSWQSCAADRSSSIRGDVPTW